MAARSFRKRLEEAVLERHCANHPMTEKWARGELSNRCLMGWAAALDAELGCHPG